MLHPRQVSAFSTSVHQEGHMSEPELTRRSFLNSLGVTTGATFAAASGAVSFAGVAHAQTPPKGNIPSTPYKIGHMTFFTGPAAVLGEPMHKGNVLPPAKIHTNWRTL